MRIYLILIVFVTIVESRDVNTDGKLLRTKHEHDGVSKTVTLNKRHVSKKGKHRTLIEERQTEKLKTDSSKSMNSDSISRIHHIKPASKSLIYGNNLLNKDEVSEYKRKGDMDYDFDNEDDIDVVNDGAEPAEQRSEVYGNVDDSSIDINEENIKGAKEGYNIEADDEEKMIDAKLAKAAAEEAGDNFADTDLSLPEKREHDSIDQSISDGIESDEGLMATDIDAARKNAIELTETPPPNEDGTLGALLTEVWAIRDEAKKDDAAAAKKKVEKKKAGKKDDTVHVADSQQEKDKKVARLLAEGSAIVQKVVKQKVAEFLAENKGLRNLKGLKKASGISDVKKGGKKNKGEDHEIDILKTKASEGDSAQAIMASRIKSFLKDNYKSPKELRKLEGNIKKFFKESGVRHPDQIGTKKSSGVNKETNRSIGKKENIKAYKKTNTGSKKEIKRLSMEKKKPGEVDIQTKKANSTEQGKRDEEHRKIEKQEEQKDSKAAHFDKKKVADEDEDRPKLKKNFKGSADVLVNPHPDKENTIKKEILNAAKSNGTNNERNETSKEISSLNGGKSQTDKEKNETKTDISSLNKEKSGGTGTNTDEGDSENSNPESSDKVTVVGIDTDEEAALEKDSTDEEVALEKDEEDETVELEKGAKGITNNDSEFGNSQLIEEMKRNNSRRKQQSVKEKAGAKPEPPMVETPNLAFNGTNETKASEEKPKILSWLEGLKNLDEKDWHMDADNPKMLKALEEEKQNKSAEVNHVEGNNVKAVTDEEITRNYKSTSKGEDQHFMAALEKGCPKNDSLIPCRDIEKIQRFTNTSEDRLSDIEQNNQESGYTHDFSSSSETDQDGMGKPEVTEYTHEYSSSSETVQEGNAKPKTSGYAHDFTAEGNLEEGKGNKPNGTLKINEKHTKFGTEIEENKLDNGIGFKVEEHSKVIDLGNSNTTSDAKAGMKNLNISAEIEKILKFAKDGKIVQKGKDGKGAKKGKDKKNHHQNKSTKKSSDTLKEAVHDSNKTSNETVVSANEIVNASTNASASSVPNTAVDTSEMVAKNASMDSMLLLDTTKAGDINDCVQIRNQKILESPEKIKDAQVEFHECVLHHHSPMRLRGSYDCDRFGRDRFNQDPIVAREAEDDFNECIRKHHKLEEDEKDEKDDEECSLFRHHKANLLHQMEKDAERDYDECLAHHEKQKQTEGYSPHACVHEHNFADDPKIREADDNYNECIHHRKVEEIDREREKKPFKEEEKDDGDHNCIHLLRHGPHEDPNLEKEIEESFVNCIHRHKKPSKELRKEEVENEENPGTNYEDCLRHYDSQKNPEDAEEDFNNCMHRHRIAKGDDHDENRHLHYDEKELGGYRDFSHDDGKLYPEEVRNCVNENSCMYDEEPYIPHSQEGYNHERPHEHEHFTEEEPENGKVFENVHGHPTKVHSNDNVNNILDYLTKAEVASALDGSIIHSNVTQIVPEGVDLHDIYTGQQHIEHHKRNGNATDDKEFYSELPHQQKSNLHSTSVHHDQLEIDGDHSSLPFHRLHKMIRHNKEYSRIPIWNASFHDQSARERESPSGMHLTDDKTLLSYAARINEMDPKNIFTIMMKKGCEDNEVNCRTGTKRVCEGDPRKCRSVNEITLAPPIISNVTEKPKSEGNTNVTSVAESQRVQGTNSSAHIGPTETLKIDGPTNDQQTIEDIVKDHLGNAYHNVGFVESDHEKSGQPSFNESSLNLHPDEVATPLPVSAEKFVRKDDYFVTAYATTSSDKKHFVHKNLVENQLGVDSAINGNDRNTEESLEGIALGTKDQKHLVGEEELGLIARALNLSVSENAQTRTTAKGHSFISFDTVENDQKEDKISNFSPTARSRNIRTKPQQRFTPQIPYRDKDNSIVSGFGSKESAHKMPAFTKNSSSNHSKAMSLLALELSREKMEEKAYANLTSDEKETDIEGNDEKSDNSSSLANDIIPDSNITSSSGLIEPQKDESTGKFELKSNHPHLENTSETNTRGNNKTVSSGDVNPDFTQGFPIPPFKTLLDRFIKWAKKNIKEHPKLTPTDIDMMKGSFKDWIKLVYSGNYSSSDEGLFKVYDSFMLGDGEEKNLTRSLNQNHLLDFFNGNKEPTNMTESKKVTGNGTKCEESLYGVCNPYAEIDEMNSTLIPMYPYHVHYPADNMYSVDGQPCLFRTCMTPSGVHQHIHHNHGDTTFFGSMMYPESQDHFVSHNPCSNNGLFIPNGPNKRTCLCLVGFIGPTCKQVDYCKMNYCKNNQTCSLTKSAPGYKCWCSKQYYGDNCQYINPCYENPCENRGHCSHNGKNEISCVCPKGFRGEKCEEINSCVPNPCLNGGTCTATASANGKDAKFTCACTDWFKGSNCELPRLCSSFPCHNGGSCTETERDFTCSCPDGFVGQYCTDYPCNPSPCFHGATCIEIGSDYQCLCPTWAKGRNCSVVNPCYSNPCRFGGQCIDVTSGYNWLFKHMQYYCLCKPPHMGPHCTDNICNYCSPNAFCDNSSKCICDKGYYGNGYVCEPEEPDPCHPNPCQNGGLCISRPNSEFYCNCTEPFKPPLCIEKVPCEPDPCKNGQCIPKSDGTFTCNCYPGYSGKHCNVTSPCEPNPCLHGGECVMVDEKDGKWECRCPYPKVYKGALCHECTCPASDDPSVRPGSHCDPRVNKCVCNENFNASKWEFDSGRQECVVKAQAPSSSPEQRGDSGKNSSGKDDAGTDKGSQGSSSKSAIDSLIQPTDAPAADICQPDNPCKNGGRCVLMKDDPGYRCICKEWWIGPLCSVRRACVPENPCLNGATCKEDGKGGYVCECPDGYSGRLCEVQGHTSICYPNPCKNGGICHDLVGKYDCECLSRYTGPHCQIDKCANCDPNALCVAGRCKCRSGWTGNGYECIKEAPSCNCGELQSCACVGCPCECNPGYEAVFPNGVTQSKICVPLSVLMPEPLPTAMTLPPTEPTEATRKPTWKPKVKADYVPPSKGYKKNTTPKEHFLTKLPSSQGKEKSDCPSSLSYSALKDCQRAKHNQFATKKPNKRTNNNADIRNKMRTQIQTVLGNPRPKDGSFNVHLPTHRSYYRRPSPYPSFLRQNVPIRSLNMKDKE